MSGIVICLTSSASPQSTQESRRLHSNVDGPTTRCAVTPSNALENLFLSLDTRKKTENNTESNVNVSLESKAGVRTSTRFSVNPRKARKLPINISFENALKKPSRGPFKNGVRSSKMSHIVHAFGIVRCHYIRYGPRHLGEL